MMGSAHDGEEGCSQSHDLGPRRPSRGRSSRGRSSKGRSSRVLSVLASVLAVACATETPPEQAGETGPEARPNYTIRLDSESSDLADFQVVEDDDGIRVQTGPAGIAYRADDAILTGDMHVQATFLQYDAPPGYREAYGLFLGGIDLEGADLEYTYLLIRPTGDFLVKRRIGEIVETLADWTPHPAVATVEVEGDRPVNTLGIDVFNGETHFVVNGDVVHTAPASRVRPYGIAGVRVNHRLDVRVDRWVLRGASDSS